MNRVCTVLENLGSLATLGELTSAGLRAAEIDDALRAGVLIRIRRGWYASTLAPEQAVRALRAGGAVGCITGAAMHGCWAAADPRLHVAVLNKARTIKDPDSGQDSSVDSLRSRVVFHWTAAVRLEDSRGILRLVECLAQVISCQDPEIAFAIVESALARGLLSRAQRADLWQIVPRSKRHILSAARSNAGSGNESIFRYRMMLRGVEMQSQVYVPGVGIVDFVIGDRLLVEIDSELYHGGRASRLRDIERDAVAATLGGIALRFDQSQIMNDWPWVEATVLAIIARGDHLARRQPR